MRTIDRLILSALKGGHPKKIGRKIRREVGLKKPKYGKVERNGPVVV